MHLESLSLFLAAASLSLFAGNSSSQPELNNQLPRNRRSISHPKLNRSVIAVCQALRLYKPECHIVLVRPATTHNKSTLHFLLRFCPPRCFLWAFDLKLLWPSSGTTFSDVNVCEYVCITVLFITVQ